MSDIGLVTIDKDATDPKILNGIFRDQKPLGHTTQGTPPFQPSRSGLTENIHELVRHERTHAGIIPLGLVGLMTWGIINKEMRSWKQV
jgi:hypothetical protein